MLGNERTSSWDEASFKCRILTHNQLKPSYMYVPCTKHRRRYNTWIVEVTETRRTLEIPMIHHFAPWRIGLIIHPAAANASSYHTECMYCCTHSSSPPWQSKSALPQSSTAKFFRLMVLIQPLSWEVWFALTEYSAIES
jgi:hypothetical protein